MAIQQNIEAQIKLMPDEVQEPIEFLLNLIDQKNDDQLSDQEIEQKLEQAVENALKK